MRRGGSIRSRIAPRQVRLRWRGCVWVEASARWLHGMLWVAVRRWLLRLRRLVPSAATARRRPRLEGGRIGVERRCCRMLALPVWWPGLILHSAGDSVIEWQCAC